ncbi:hypothetical protein PoB_000782300 [Plakobranchus ocellatus]|uniref:Uncharacterized protein n=1 Tax=Plakobranchus ocellatus TaxID=259542 RepID=A0AAV3YFR9_9GAST|nr:hypothetical protein PoB_000782300 [Plakobranchus ocellatus]
MELSPHCGRSKARIRGGGGRWRTGEKREVGVLLYQDMWAPIIDQCLIGAMLGTGGDRGGEGGGGRQETGKKGGAGQFTPDQCM